MCWLNLPRSARPSSPWWRASSPTENRHNVSYFSFLISDDRRTPVYPRLRPALIISAFCLVTVSIVGAWRQKAAVTSGFSSAPFDLEVAPASHG